MIQLTPPNLVVVREGHDFHVVGLFHDSGLPYYMTIGASFASVADAHLFITAKTQPEPPPSQTPLDRSR